MHLSYDEGLPGIWGKQRNAVNLTGERREHEISGTREQSESFEKSTGTRNAWETLHDVHISLLMLSRFYMTKFS